MAEPKPETGATAHWDRYWGAARVAACFEGADANYADDIRREWEEFFRSLPAGSRVLDIGTGNGAILLFARQVSDADGLEFKLTGVDSAAIDPARVLPERSQLFDGIAFHGRVDAAAMPFEDAVFDALCSQYSVEYMEREPVLAELSRVAAPGAQLQFVVHSSPGAALEAGEEELALRDFLLDEVKITERARRAQLFIAALERSGEAPSPEQDGEARKLLNAFETGLARLQRRIEESAAGAMAGEADPGRPDPGRPDPTAQKGVSPMLRNTLGLLVRTHQERARFSEAQLDANITALEQEIESHAARLRELRRAACDVGELQRLCAQLAAAGFEQPTTRALLRARDSAQIGWLVETSKV